MKKTIVFLTCIIAFGILAFVLFFTVLNKGQRAETAVGEKTVVINSTASAKRENGKAFTVYIDGKPDIEFDEYREAYNYAGGFRDASIWSRETGRYVWDNYLPYQVYYTTSDYVEFDSYYKAVSFAKSEERSFIYYRKNSAMLWSNVDPLPTEYKLEGVTHIQQLPELPRGCEVTSLAMLMKYKGVNVSKLELADKIVRDSTPYSRIGNKIHYGHPNVGFVGDMKSLKAPGLGVYHKPIHSLLESYLPYSALDLTGGLFEDLFTFICKKSPVWVIINTSYKKLPESEFEVWSTSEGDIKITYKEHSVLVTGYDEEYIYFNDPLSATPTSRAKREEFIEAWEQMGRQAVTIVY